MSRRMLGFSAACVTWLIAADARGAAPALPSDGWASWEVAAVEDAPAFCCWSSSDKRITVTKACDLDSGEQGYGTRDDTHTDMVRVYVKLANGKVQKLRTLSASCPVETRTPIRTLEGISADDSARWLGSVRSGLDRDDWLSSLAIHRGDLPFNALENTARTDTDLETRRQAIFWLAMLRGTAGAEVVADVLFNDQNADIREHAAFALTQSRSPRIAADLTKAGKSDTSGEVRAQAWFWLAKSGAPDAEAPILTAMTRDQDDHVREQAVFALSQLPGDRATRALIRAAEDRSLSREQRKRALFWLAQSQAPDAQAYLDRVLLGDSGAKASRP